MVTSIARTTRSFLTLCIAATTVLIATLAAPASADSRSTDAPEVNDAFVSTQPSGAQHVSRRNSGSHASPIGLRSSQTVGANTPTDPRERLDIAAMAAEQVAPRRLAELSVDPDSLIVKSQFTSLTSAERSELRAISDAYRIPVQVTEGATVSREQREHATDRLAESDVAKQAGAIMVSANLRPDAVTVHLKGGVPNDDIRKDLERVAQVPVVFKTGASTPEPEIGARNSDRPPFWGGAKLRFGRGAPGASGWCTSGFAVIHGGVGKLATARHCNPADSFDTFNGSGTMIARRGSAARN